MSAREMTASIKRLRCGNLRFDEWEHKLDSGVVVHVRSEPWRYSGVFYRVWATKRNRILAMLFAETSETAGKKARSLVTKYGAL